MDFSPLKLYGFLALINVLWLALNQAKADRSVIDQENLDYDKSNSELVSTNRILKCNRRNRQ